MSTYRELDIEVEAGTNRVVAVWHGCLMLPFKICTVNSSRAEEVAALSAELNAAKPNHTMQVFDRRINPPNKTQPATYQEPSSDINSREV